MLSLSESAEDMPLTLETTERWPHANTQVTIWEIVAELVTLCVTPNPKNPFEIAFESLAGVWTDLPPTLSEAVAVVDDVELNDLERALNYGAVAGLLHEIFLSDAAYAPYGTRALRSNSHYAHPTMHHTVLTFQQNLISCCGAVADDMRRCTERHFECMADLLSVSSSESRTTASNR